MTMALYMHRLLPGILITLLASLAAPGIVHAQGGAVEGTVSDTTGLALPGVTVEARGTAAGGAVAVAVTDGAGAFTIGGLAPGAYDLAFTLPGFHAVVRASVAVGAGAAVRLDIELAVQFEEQVVVVGSRGRPSSPSNHRR